MAVKKLCLQFVFDTSFYCSLRCFTSAHSKIFIACDSTALQPVCLPYFLPGTSARSSHWSVGSSRSRIFVRENWQHLRRALVSRTRPFSAMAPSSLLFRQLFEKESSTYTYLLADLDQPEKPAVIIDPVDKTSDRDVKLINELGLTLLYALNTHVHADHITGTASLKEKIPGVKSIISESSGARADIHVKHGDRVKFGKHALEVRETPGHTAGCVTYVTEVARDEPSPDGPPSPQRAFTGDTLLIRGCGRTDFQGGDARQLYKSVHSQILSLPKDTLLFPAHDYRGFTVTTVGEELRHNPRLTKTEDEFKELMDNLNLPFPRMMQVAMPANLACGHQD